MLQNSAAVPDNTPTLAGSVFVSGQGACMGRRRGDHIRYRFDLERLEPRRLLSAAVQSVGVVDPIVAPNPNSSDITIDDISDQIIALRDGSFNGTLLTFTGPE